MASPLRVRPLQAAQAGGCAPGEALRGFTRLAAVTLVRRVPGDAAALSRHHSRRPESARAWERLVQFVTPSEQMNDRQTFLYAIDALKLLGELDQKRVPPVTRPGLRAACSGRARWPAMIRAWSVEPAKFYPAAVVTPQNRRRSVAVAASTNLLRCPGPTVVALTVAANGELDPAPSAALMSKFQRSQLGITAVRRLLSWARPNLCILELMKTFYLGDWHTDVLQRIFLQESFIEDARCIAAIPEAVFDAAIRATQQASGFLGPRQLLEMLETVVPDTEQQQSLANFLIHLGRFRREAGDEPAAFAQEASSKLREAAADKMTEQELDVVASRLLRIVEPKSGIELQAKAESVIRRMGEPLEELTLVCDLRPVFDEDRQIVHGMVPLTSMRVVVSNPDGLPRTVEARLTEEQVIKLCKEAEKARKKLETLKKLLSEKNVELPESFMTLSEPSK